MSFLCCVKGSKNEINHDLFANREGVMPKKSFYGRNFTKILGNAPEQNILESRQFHKKHTFKPQELVVVTVKNEKEDEVTVFGRIMEGQGLGKYEVATKDPDNLPFGFIGYLHTIPTQNIGKIPPSFSEYLISLEGK